MSIIKYFSRFGKLKFTIDDVLLFDCAQNGDSDAYSNLFERYIDSVLFVYQYDSRMEYADLRQDVYVKTSSSLSKIDSINVWASFCKKTARGLLKDAEKKSKPILYDDNADTKTKIDNLADSNRYSSPSFNLLNDEIKQVFFDEVKIMSDIDQRISFLFFIEEFSIARISKELNMPWSTVHDHVDSIRNKLSQSKKLQSLIDHGACPVLLKDAFDIGNAATQSSGTTASKGILSFLVNGIKWFLSLIGIIFMTMIWLMSFMILGTKGLAEYGGMEQDIENRARFIKYLFLGYALIMIFPTIHHTCGIYIPRLLAEFVPIRTSEDILGYSLKSSYLVLLIGYTLFVRSRLRHFRKRIEPKVVLFEEIAQFKTFLRRFINIGSVVIGLNIVFFCLYYLLGLYEYPKYSFVFLLKHNTFDSTLPGLILFMGYHLFSWRVFLKLISELDCEYSPEDYRKKRQNGIRLLTFAGMVFTLTLPFIGMILSDTKRIPDGIIFFSFLIIWLSVIKWNKSRQVVFPVFLIAIIQWGLLQFIATLLKW